MTSELGKRILENLPDPIEIETEGLGRLLFSNWTVKAVSDVTELFEHRPTTGAEFVQRFAECLARHPAPEADTLKMEFDAGQKISETDALTRNDIETIANHYLVPVQKRQAIELIVKKKNLGIETSRET